MIKVRDNDEDIECVLFNSAATEILGLTVEELITKTLKEASFLKENISIFMNTCYNCITTMVTRLC